MKFEWDEEKNNANERKHCIRFEDVIEIFSGNSSVWRNEDQRFDYGEKRYISIGHVADDLFLVVVHTERNGKIRIISARKANKKEVKSYYEQSEEKKN